MTKGSGHVFVGNKPVVREEDLPQCGGHPDHKKAHHCFVGTGHMSAIRTIKTGKVQMAPRHLVTARGGDATHPHHAPGAHPIHVPVARPHHAPHSPLVTRSVCFVPTPTPFVPYAPSWQSMLKAPTPGQSSLRRAPHYTPLQKSLLSAQAKAVLAREGLTAWFTGIPGRATAAARDLDQGLQDPNQNPNGFHPGLLASGLGHMVINTARAGVPVIKDLFSDPSDPFSTSRAGTKQEDLDNFVDKAILFHPAVASTVAVAGVLQPAADPISKALSAYHNGDRAGALHLLKTAPGAVGEYARQNKLETALAAAGVLHAPVLRAARKTAGARAVAAVQETAAVRKMSPAHEAALLKAEAAREKAHERRAAGQGGQSGLSSPVIGKPQIVRGLSGPKKFGAFSKGLHILDAKQLALHERLVKSSPKGGAILKPGEISFGDIAKLTKATHLEHAVVRLKDGSRVLLRGDSKSVMHISDLPVKRLIVHSHPGDRPGVLEPSGENGDMDYIWSIGQRRSYIVTSDAHVPGTEYWLGTFDNHGYWRALNTPPFMFAGGLIPYIRGIQARR